MSGWTIQYELYFSGSLAAVTYILLCKIAANTTGLKGTSFHIANIGCRPVIFSFAQSENWLNQLGIWQHNDLFIQSSRK